MRIRFVPLVLLALSVSVLAASCRPLSKDEQEELNEAIEAQVPTIEARLTASAEAGPTPMPTIEVSPTPMVVQLDFDDPSGDLVVCTSGEPMPASEADYIDLDRLTLYADQDEFSLEVNFPLTEDLLNQMTFPGSFLGVLVLDDSADPLPADPNLGDLALGLMRIDAIWNGQELESRVFARDEAGAMVEQDIPVGIQVIDGNVLKFDMKTQYFPETANAAGFSTLSLNACDYAGLSFDFSSGTRGEGFPELTIQEITEAIARYRNPIN